MAGTDQSKGVRPFGARDKFGYMFGDFGNDFMFLFASSFLMVFYTKIMGIPGALVGVMFLIARVIDAFADVTVGVIADRAKSGPAGKYRPIMLRMAVPAVVFSILMYQSFLVNAPMAAKVVYMFATYIIWGETGRPGYGLYDRALGIAYINGVWETLDKCGDTWSAGE